MLITRVIIFEVFQHMRAVYINVTDEQLSASCGNKTKHSLCGENRLNYRYTIQVLPPSLYS